MAAFLGVYYSTTFSTEKIVFNIVSNCNQLELYLLQGVTIVNMI
jgi:hypothetical protein